MPELLIPTSIERARSERPCGALQDFSAATRIVRALCRMRLRGVVWDEALGLEHGFVVVTVSQEFAPAGKPDVGCVFQALVERVERGVAALRANRESSVCQPLALVVRDQGLLRVLSELARLPPAIVALPLRIDEQTTLHIPRPEAADIPAPEDEERTAKVELSFRGYRATGREMTLFLGASLEVAVQPCIDVQSLARWTLDPPVLVGTVIRRGSTARAAPGDLVEVPKQSNLDVTSSAA
jgi:hypothetical protein